MTLTALRRADARTPEATGGTPSPTQTQPLPVSLRGVGRSFATASGEHTVLSGIDRDITAGSITAIIGASGSGKSTLLRLIAGLDRATSGQLLIDGRPVAPYDDRCAVAFQEARLLPWRSVRRNIALGLARGADPEIIDRLVDLVGLSDFAGHRPREISGGMAQRVSLARALARRPGVLLLDEPFGALDALTRIKMQSLLLELHAAAPSTVVMVTHDVDEAIKLADTVLVLGSSAAHSRGATIIHDVTVTDDLRHDPVRSTDLHRELLACLGVREP